MHAQTVPILTIILPYKCILLIPVAWLKVSASGVKSVKCAGGKWYMRVPLNLHKASDYL